MEDEDQIIKNYKSILNNAKANWIYEDYEILLKFLDLYKQEKEKNKKLNRVIEKMANVLDLNFSLSIKDYKFGKKQKIIDYFKKEGKYGKKL